MIKRKGLNLAGRTVNLVLFFEKFGEQIHC